MRVDAVGAETLAAIAGQLDCVEVINARAVRREDNLLSTYRRLVRSLGVG